MSFNVQAGFVVFDIFFPLTVHYIDENTTMYSQQVILCGKHLENTNFNRWQGLVSLKVIPGLFIVSLIFLGLLITHIWRTQRSKLFGWLMLSSVVMLFIFYLFNCVIRLASKEQLKGGCEVSGLIIQFSYMSSILWLSCMSFFMWKTFRKMTPVNVTAKPYTWGCQDPSYKWFAIFSWGLPLVMTIVTLILQHTGFDTEKYVSPNIGVEHCFLGKNLPTLLYFHIINAPALVIIL